MAAVVSEWSLIQQLSPSLQAFDISNVSESEYQSVVNQKKLEFLMSIRARMGVLREVAAGVIACMAVASLIGNSLVCCVLHRHPSLRSVTNVFLLNLSLAQITLAALAVPVNLAKILAADPVSWGALGRAGCSVAHFVNSACVCASSLTLVCIAVDRHRVIVTPLKPRLTWRAVKVMLLGCWILSATIGLVNSRVLFPAHRSDLNGVYILHDQTLCAFSPWADSRLRLGLSCLALLTQYVLPLLLIIAIYARIIRTLWTAHTELQGRIPARKRTTLMLILVMALFFISWSPIHLYFISGNWRTVSDLRREVLLHSVCYWLAVSNIWYNPIIYAWLNVRFRSSLLHLMAAANGCCRCCRQRAVDDGTSSRRAEGGDGDEMEMGDMLCARSLWRPQELQGPQQLGEPPSIAQQHAVSTPQ